MSHRLLLICITLIAASLATGPVAGQQILSVSPALPTSDDEVTVNLSVVLCGFRVATMIQGNMIYLYPDLTEACPPLAPPDPGAVTQPSFGPLAAGSYTLVVVANGMTTDSRTLFVQQPTTQLALHKARFSASVNWTLPGGQGAGAAQAVQLNESSGYFWFFDKDSVEVTLKILGGPDQYYWVFVSSGTNVAFTLTIVDTWLCANPSSCVSRTFQNPAGTNQNFFDFSTFTYF